MDFEKFMEELKNRLHVEDFDDWVIFVIEAKLINDLRNSKTQGGFKDAVDALHQAVFGHPECTFDKNSGDLEAYAKIIQIIGQIIQEQNAEEIKYIQSEQRLDGSAETYQIISDLRNAEMAKAYREFN